MNAPASGAVGGASVVRADGEVASAEIARSSHPLAQTATCIVEAIRRWRFPRPEGGVEVTVLHPFTLSPADPGGDASSPPPSAEEVARLDALRPIAERGDARALRDAVERFCADLSRSRLCPDARLSLAELYFTQRQFADARGAYQAIVAAPAVVPVVAGYARYKLAWTLHNLNEHGAALSSMTDAMDVLTPSRSNTARAPMQNLRAELVGFVGAGTAVGSPAADSVRLLRRYAADEAGAREMLSGLARWYREHQRADDAAALERAAAGAPPSATSAP